MFRFRAVSAILLFSFLFHPSVRAHASTSVKNLPPVYRHWIEVEVPYIITAEERKHFLVLTTNEERDTFIEAFWRIRNPDPNSGVNTYKEEHYRRLAYANQNFGTAKYEDGWRTDMGRMYIVLGPPKQRGLYHALANVRDMEIWFYQSDTPALPPYFYLLFYKRSPIDPYQLYSPTQDGPVRLVSTGESRQDKSMSIHILRTVAGDEVAKTAITLLPNESIDFDRPEPSMESDMLLSTLGDLPDNPVTKARLDANRLREHVTTSILSGETAPEFSYEVFRDDKGASTLSYLLKFRTPDPRLIGPAADKSFKYDLSLRTTIMTSDGKPVYDQEESLTGRLTEPQAELAQHKRFGAEGRLPLAPGKYVVVATLTNNLTQLATRQHADVEVAAPKSPSIALSPLMAYTAPSPVKDPNDALPFSAGHFRFTPRGAQTVDLRQGEKLPLVFQLWLEPQAPGTIDRGKVHLHYVFGAASGAHETATEENEDVEAADRGPTGNLLTGRTVDTSNLTVGTYRLVVGATREGRPQTAYSTMTLHVEPASTELATWTAYAASPGRATDDLKRGLSAEAQGADALAQNYYSQALSEGPGDLRSLDKLAALLVRKVQTEDLAALSQQSVMSVSAVAPKTLLAIAQALTKAGNPKAVVRMLDAQIKLQPPSAELYRALADACEATGNSARARDLRSLATGIN